jgi:hypothetical protein
MTEDEIVKIDDFGEPILSHVDEEIDLADITSDPIDQKPLRWINIITAKQIALMLVSSFMLLLSAPLFYLFFLVFITNANQTILQIAVPQVIDMIKTVAAVLGGLVGSVTTYYFAVEKRHND